MSLDVTLLSDNPSYREPREAIFIREGGRNKEISLDEWNIRFPGRVPCTMRLEGRDDHTIFDANITHNLGRMAEEANLYKAMWRPEESGWTHAHHILPILADGLALLLRKPEHFRTFNPDNGWGTYETLVEFTIKYLNACFLFQDAKIEVSR